MLHFEEPFAFVLSNIKKGNYCDKCFRCISDLKKCSGCKLMYYCNIRCQKNDWKSFHKHECKRLQEIHPKNPTDSVRLLHRILLKLDNNDALEVEIFGQKRRFSSLEGHVDLIIKDDTRVSQFYELLSTLRTYAGEHYLFPSMEAIIGIFGRMVINSISICDDEMSVLGVGLYLGASVLNHSCDPDAIINFNGTSLQLIGTNDKAANIPCISYIDQLYDTSERQFQLMESYYFKCSCDLCGNSEINELKLSAACSKIACSGSICTDLNKMKKICPLCSNCMDESHIVKAQQMMTKSKELVIKLDNYKKNEKFQEIYVEAKEHLRMQEQILHTCNIYYVFILDRLFDASIQLEVWDEALIYGMKTLSPYEKYYPFPHPNVGVQKMKLGKILLYCNKMIDAQNILRDSMKILSLTHGSQTSIIHDLGQLLRQCEFEMSIENSKQ